MNSFLQEIELPKFHPSSSPKHTRCPAWSASSPLLRNLTDHCTQSFSPQICYHLSHFRFELVFELAQIWLDPSKAVLANCRQIRRVSSLTLRGEECEQLHKPPSTHSLRSWILFGWGLAGSHKLQSKWKASLSSCVPKRRETSCFSCLHLTDSFLCTTIALKRFQSLHHQTTFVGSC